MYLRKNWTKLVGVVATLAFLCPTVSSETDLFVSLIQLISNPDKYDGGQVGVVGFLRLEYEGDRLYFHREDFTNNLIENSIRIGLTKDDRQKFENRNMKYVFLVGTFHAGKRGTPDSNGAIINITKIEILPGRSGTEKK